MTGLAPTVEPLPARSTVEPAADLRTRLAGRILIGGSPLTITRLSIGGAELVRRWFAGAEVGPDPKHQALARRLIASGMAHPRLDPGDPTPGRRMTVIIPVNDDQTGLDGTLDRLLGSPDAAPADDLAIVVVDDGSSTPIDVDHRPVRLIRRATAGGPGRARQAALEIVVSDDTGHAAVVAFLDAGVLAAAADLRQLARRLDDPTVAAVAPRVRSIAGDHPVARFDDRRSPLDLGPTESLVGPGRLVPYVPTACLVARTEAVVSAGGFDPGLRYGEDVDLVWRLALTGSIAYQPTVEVWHPPRTSIAAMAAQRRAYGSAAVPLAERHGAAVSPARISPWSLLVLVLAVAGRPVAAAATVVGTGLALKSKIRPLPDLTVEALLLTGRGHFYGALSVLTAAVRAWAPLLALTWLLFPSQRRRIATVVVVAFGRRLLDGPRRPGPAVLDLALGSLDDLAYCSGVWQGALASRSRPAIVGALAPALTSWPTPSRPENKALAARRWLGRLYSAMKRSSS